MKHRNITECLQFSLGHPWELERLLPTVRIKRQATGMQVNLGISLPQDPGAGGSPLSHRDSSDLTGGEPGTFQVTYLTPRGGQAVGT